MIATVRIAPVERWCRFARAHACEAFRNAVGREVKIDTGKMKVNPDDGSKFWPLVGADREWFKSIEPGENTSLCEHVLEMD